MNIKNTILLLLQLIVILFCNIIKCEVQYTIQEVTPYDGKNVYATNNLYCGLNLYIIVNVLTPNEPLLSIDISTLPNNSSTPTPSALIRYQQDNYYYYNLILNPLIGDTITVLTLNFNNSEKQIFSFLTYKCQDVPEFWDIIKVENEPYKYNGIGLVGYYRMKFNITNYGDKLYSNLIKVNCNTSGIYCLPSGLNDDSGFSLFDINFQILKDFKGGINEFKITFSSGRGGTIVSVPLPTKNYNSNSVVFNPSNYVGFFSKGYYYSIYKSVLYDPSKQFDLVEPIDSIFRVMHQGEGVPGNATFISGGGGTTLVYNSSDYYGLYSIDSTGVHNIYLVNSINVGYSGNNSPVINVFKINFTISNIKPTIEISTQSKLKDINIGFENKIIKQYSSPFGIVGRSDLSVFLIKITALSSNYVKSRLYINSLFSDTEYVPFTYVQDLISPKVISFSVSSFNGLSKVARIRIVDMGQAGFYSLLVYSITIGVGNLVSGDIHDGIYEFASDIGFGSTPSTFNQAFSAFIYDNAFNGALYANVYKIGPPSPQSPSIPTVSYFVDPIGTFSFSKFNITQFYFSIPYGTPIDTTNKFVSLSLYMNTTNHDEELNITPYILFGKTFTGGKQATHNSDIGKNQLFQGYWNKTISLYQIDFKIPMNQFTTSSLFYSIVWDTLLITSSSLIQVFPRATLSVYSDYSDTLGPMIIDLIKIHGNQEITIDNGTGNKIVGWSFKIQDFNGFENGTIIVTSRELQIDRTFKITSLDGPNYSIEIEISPKCISQTLFLSSIILVDKGGYSSSNELTESSTIYVRSNPLTYINGTDILEIKLNCPLGVGFDFANSPGPQLKSLNVYPKSLDVGLENRFIKFTFSVENIDKSIFPVIYLGAINFQYIPITDCHIINSTSDGSGNTITSYEASTNVDYGFGYSGGSIMISIYGLYDSWGNLNGYSTEMLGVNGYDNLIYVPSFTLNSPIINSVSNVNTWGGILTVFGNGFGAGGNDSLVQVDYLDGLGFNSLTHQFNSGVYKVVKIRPTNYSFNIRVINTASDITSSILLVYPINSIERPPLTPPPTNPPPLKCLGTPECSGTSNGYCNTAKSTCICYSPWSGLDCSSKIIIISPPLIDETKPIVNITLDSGNGNSNSQGEMENGENELLTSLINVVSLREFDINNQIVSQHIFEQWLFTNVTSKSIPTNNNLEYLYSNIIQEDDSDYNCTINVLVQWFKEESKYSFANSNFSIPASSIKYNINITHYPFKSNLNTLQLVMSVSIQSSKTADACSSKDFGVADEINQYLKLSVNKKSIFGIFVNRGVIDSRIVAISNTILESLLNETTTLQNNAHTSSSYVGVNIPYFSGLACLDPSFNVLLDSNDNDNENSICSNKSKSGLTNAQIAGIVVGSVVGFSIIVTILIVFLKSTKGKIAIKAIKLKSYNK